MPGPSPGGGRGGERARYVPPSPDPHRGGDEAWGGEGAGAGRLSVQPRAELLEVAGVAGAAVPVAGRRGFHALDALLGHRVAREELLDLRRTALPQLEELAEEVGRAPRVVS